MSSLERGKLGKSQPLKSRWIPMLDLINCEKHSLVREASGAVGAEEESTVGASCSRFSPFPQFPPFSRSPRFPRFPQFPRFSQFPPPRVTASPCHRVLTLPHFRTPNSEFRILNSTPGTAIAITARGKNRTRVCSALGYSITSISVNFEEIQRKTLN